MSTDRAPNPTDPACIGDSACMSDPLFQASASIEIFADPAIVYATVSDLPRSRQWSSECRGGLWESGDPGERGAVFRGENFRSPEVVGWAPVVRGTWFTTAEIVAAEPGRHFAWAMRTQDGRVQESVWSYYLEATADGTVLTHAFEMAAATEGIAGIVSGLDDRAIDSFFIEWGVKVDTDIAATVRRIRDVIERDVALGRKAVA